MSKEMQAREASMPKKTKGMRRSGTCKALMVLISTVSAAGIFGGALLSGELFEAGVYTESKNEIGKQQITQHCQEMISDIRCLWQDIVNCQSNPYLASQEYIDLLCRDLTSAYDPSVSNFEFVITDPQGEVLLQSYTDGEYQYSWTEPFYRTFYETTTQRMTCHEWSVFNIPEGADCSVEEVWITEPVQTAPLPETSADPAASPLSEPTTQITETLYSDESTTQLPTEFMAETVLPAEYYQEDYEIQQGYEENLYYDVTISYPISELTYYITGYVRSELTADDELARQQQFFAFAYDYRYIPPIVLSVCVLTFLSSLIYLLWAAGWRRDEEKPSGGIFEKLPFDVFTCMLGFAFAMLLVFADSFVNTFSGLLELGLVISVLLLLWLIVLWWLVSTAVRIRTKTILSNNLIVILWKKFWKAAGNGLDYMQQVPVIGLVLLVSAGFFFVHLISTVILAGGNEFGLVLLILLYTAMVAGICISVVNMHLLQKGGEKIASGDLEHKIPENKLFGPFRMHGIHLNSIGDGMNLAVSERIRSEMFKTELIANVSHDIRTPLTSIINYTDLLSKLELENTQAQEYIAVLTRQSARLRKLTEDVLEASKATTGSMKVEKEKLDLRVLLEQIQGEYAEKLEAGSLQMICDIPEEPLYISADGRLLWRVMDNLFSNVCKYAMQGTRVYLDAYAENGQVVLTLRNISAVQLHISADMLMERFIQGDRSRNTEGSGLGLSIAQSLTSLQGGRMELHIDGDLFKVQLSFPNTTPPTELI